MSLQKCYECGKNVSSEAKNCPNCGAMVKPIQSKPEQSNSSGCLVAIAVLIAGALFIGLVTYFGEQRANAPYREAAKMRAEDEKNKESNFIINIDNEYKLLVNYYKKKDRASAIYIIDKFKKYGKMDYKDVATIEKKLSDPKYIKAVEKELAKANRLSRQKESEQRAAYKESCYQLGFRYGRCGTMALKGYQCDPSDDIVMPVACRGLSETDRGTRDGVQSVY